MQRLLFGFLLAFATMAFAQQQYPSNPPPHATPPTFPQGQAPRQGMPPDTVAPPPRQMSSTQVGQRIQDKLSTEPALANSNVQANVTDTVVFLTGTVENESQHQLALRIVESYAGDRRILDRIVVKGQT